MSIVSLNQKTDYSDEVVRFLKLPQFFCRTCSFGASVRTRLLWEHIHIFQPLPQSYPQSETRFVTKVNLIISSLSFSIMLRSLLAAPDG